MVRNEFWAGGFGLIFRKIKRWSAPLVRMLFKLLVALGVLLGLQSSAFAGDPCEVLLAMHAQEHSDHHHDSEKPCDPSHDKHCPVEHHRLGGNCCHSMPLADEIAKPARVGALGFSLSPIRFESETAPEPPFVELDKPPLN